MKLTPGQVQKATQLANLPLTDNEQEIYSEQLSTILGYFEQLEKIPTGKITPTYNTTGSENILAEDNMDTFFTQEQALLNGVNVSDGLFIAKGVFDE